MRRFVFISLLQLLPIFAFEYVLLNNSFAKDNKQLEKYVSLTHVFCDQFSVDVPPEVKQVSVTEVTPSISDPGQKSKKSISVKIFPTAFWEGKEEKIDHDVSSVNIPEIHAIGLLKPVQYQGRILHGLTQKGIDGVYVAIKSEDGAVLSETYADREGFFTVFSWVRKEANEIKLYFHQDEFDDYVHAASPDQHVVGPIMLTPLGQILAEACDPNYHMIALRADDGLGNSINGLKVILMFIAKNGKRMRLKMFERDGLYSALLAKSFASKITQCAFSIEDPTGRWKQVTKKIDCSFPQLINESLMEKEYVFVNGMVRMEDFKKCKVWLIPTANTTTQDKIDMVDIDEKGNFRFLFREGKEKNKYRLGITWDDLMQSGATPMWLSPESYTPAKSGNTNKYTLGTGIALDVPKDYIGAFSYLSCVQSGDELLQAEIIPVYAPEVTSVVNRVNESLGKEKKPPAIALNTANSFEIALPNDKNKIATKENRFIDGKYISLKQGNDSTPTIIALLPVGNPLTIKEMKNILKANVNDIIKNPDIRDTKLLLACGDWSSDVQSFQQNCSGLDSIKAELISRFANFSYIINTFILEKPGLENIDSTLRHDLVLFIDDTFLQACAIDSFEPTDQEKNLLESLSVVIFSESYMEGVIDKYNAVISRLEDAYKFAESFRYKVVNPLETPGMESIISQLVSSREKKKYAWIPIQTKQSAQQTQQVEQKESDTQTKQEDSEMPEISTGTSAVTTVTDEGNGDTVNNGDETMSNKENKQTNLEVDEKKDEVKEIPVTNQGTTTGSGENKTN